jgi:heat shock protein HslJ
MQKFGLGVGFLLVALYTAIAATASPVQLAGTEWGFPGETGKNARFLQFHSSGKVVGFAGCNRFTGYCSQHGSMLSFGPLATTRRACLPGAMKREEQFLEALSLARSAEGGPLKLTLRDAKGDVLVQLVRRSPD